jgi:alpha-tubulin suppressor-like RCC1 family protein
VLLAFALGLYGCRSKKTSNERSNIGPEPAPTNEPSTTTASSKPSATPPKRNPVAAREDHRLSLGPNHFCMIKEDRTVACLGENSFEQLGDRSIRNAKAVDALERSTCAVTANGQVWCWGASIGGKKDSKPQPIRIAGIDNAIDVRGGDGHACVLRNDKTVWCWGGNFYGAVGDGTKEDRTEPVKVDSDVAALDARSRHTCAVTTEGIVRCWGYADSLVRDDSEKDPWKPTKVADVANVVGISTNYFSACAWLAAGAPVCWGFETHQQPHHPVGGVAAAPIDGLEDASQIAVGGDHSCALRGGAVWCWGKNDTGQLGDGTLTDRTKPAPIAGLDDVVEIAMSYSTSCARKRGGALMCWGAAYAGLFPTEDVCKTEYMEHKQGGPTATKTRCSKTPKPISLP